MVCCVRGGTLWSLPFGPKYRQERKATLAIDGGRTEKLLLEPIIFTETAMNRPFRNQLLCAEIGSQFLDLRQRDDAE